MIVLGFHGGVTLGQHEPSAALIIDGKVVAVCEEERYLRIKSSYGYLPYYSIKACLKMANIKFEDIDLIVTPGITYDDYESRIYEYIRHNFGSCPKIERVHHQEAHIYTAYYGSGFDDSFILSIDATGDGSCGMLAYADKKDGVRILEVLPKEISIGYFYTLMTYYLGFIDGDEYKVMGLAPYGEPKIDLSDIIRPTKDGWEFDWKYVRSKPVVYSPFEALYSNAIIETLGQPNRVPGSDVTPYYRDVASSTQAVFEECLLSMIDKLKNYVPECKNFCFAGGVALNCSANRKIFYNNLFENIYVSPVCSDRGLSLGCAYYGAVQSGDNPWPIWHAYHGSSYSNDEIKKEIIANGCSYTHTSDPASSAADLIANDKIIGWYQGRSEAGARALGNRSILAKCDSIEVRDTVNARIKYREEFRPFAPSAMYEKSEEYFQTDGVDFPYMSFALKTVEKNRNNIEAVVHIDGSSRLQTVRSSTNELYYELIKAYYKKTGVPVIMNTSFNLKGQPIIESPRDALMTFFGCGLDALVMGNYIVYKQNAS